jgi:hypothetical protein
VTFELDKQDLCTSSAAAPVSVSNGRITCHGTQLIIRLARIDDSGCFKCTMSDGSRESPMKKIVVQKNGMLNFSLSPKQTFILLHVLYPGTVDNNTKPVGECDKGNQEMQLYL